ncbi:MAG: PepSY-like domain-containing protein [Weeksellaceae bacterium]
MKNKITVLASIFILGIGSIYAQEIPASKVPAHIQTSFKEKFAKATDIEWEKKGELYEVEFEMNQYNEEYKAYYDIKGDLVKYKVELSDQNIPAVVSNVIKSNYPIYKIDEVEKIVQKNVTTYKVEIENDEEEEIVIYLDEKGKRLNL